MKKIISFVLIFSVLLSCFICRINAQSQVENVISFEEGVFDTVSVQGDNTVITYDHIQDAMRVSAVEDGIHCNKILVSFSECTIKAEENPVFAMRLKLSRENINFGKLYWSTESKREAGGSWFVSSNTMNPQYSDTTDWQLLVFNLKNYQSEYLIGDYVSIILALQPELINCEVADILISGMGFFKDEETANDYFYKNNGDVGIESRAIMLNANDSLEKIQAVGDNTDVFYDSEKGAIGVREITVCDDDTSKIQIDFDGNASVEKYPILAMHIKLTDADTQFGLIGLKSSGWLEALNSGYVSTHYASSKKTKPFYEPITTWQWVFFDVRMLSGEYLSGNILSLLMELQNGSTSAEKSTTVYIDAIGFLENEYELSSVFKDIPETYANIFISPDLRKDVLSASDNNTTLIYNESSGSLTVSSVTAGTRRNHIRILLEAEIEASEYPVFAMRIKLSRNNIKFGKFYWRTESKKNANNGWFVSSSVINPVFKETCEWQTVIFDLRDYGSEYLYGDYLEFNIAFQSETQVCGAADIEIAAMGMFESAGHAEEFLLEKLGVIKDLNAVCVSEEISVDGLKCSVSIENGYLASVYDTVGIHVSADGTNKKLESVMLKTDNSSYEKISIPINNEQGYFEWLYIDFSDFSPSGKLDTIEICFNSQVVVDATILLRNKEQGKRITEQRSRRLCNAVDRAKKSLNTDGYTLDSKAVLKNAITDAEVLLQEYSVIHEYQHVLSSSGKLDLVYDRLTQAFANLIPVLFGDSNTDGNIDILDVIRLKKHFCNSVKIDTVGGDANYDGAIDINDLIILKKYLLGAGESLGKFEFPIKTDISARDFAQSVTNANVTTVGKLESVRNVIYPFDSKYAFAHNPHIIYFKGRFVAMWTAGRINEDDLGQGVHFSISSDAENWSIPQPLYASKKGIYSETIAAAANFYVSGEVLYAYYSVIEIKPEYLRNNGTLRPENDCTPEMILWSRNYYVSTTDGLNWSTPQETGACSSTQNAFRASNGRDLIFMGASCRYNEGGRPNEWKITGANAQSAYDAGAGLACEACGYMTADRILRMLVRTDTGYLFYSESLDNGDTWSDLYKTNFAVESSMCNAGRLPDGRYYIIANSENKSTWDRIPLYLYVSNDGMNFNKRYIIRDETDYQMQQSGIAKGGSFAYPTTLIKDGYMYIIYSKQKEIIEVTKFDLGQIGE